MLFIVELPGVSFKTGDFEQNEHCGTHVDAPAHFGKGKWSIGDIPLQRLSGPGVGIDISERARYTYYEFDKF